MFFTEKIKLEDPFDYKKLCNVETRKATFEDEYKKLINTSLSKGFIKVEKFLIADNVTEELWKIGEMKNKNLYIIRQWLRDYHNESDYHLSPFIYIINKLAPDFKVVKNQETGVISIESCINIKLCHRIDGLNAVSRIYLPDEKIALNSFNDNVQNLGETLAVKDIHLYVISLESVTTEHERIVAYKLTPSAEYLLEQSQLEDKSLAKHNIF